MAARGGAMRRTSSRAAAKTRQRAARSRSRPDRPGLSQEGGTCTRPRPRSPAQEPEGSRPERQDRAVIANNPRLAEFASPDPVGNHAIRPCDPRSSTTRNAPCSTAAARGAALHAKILRARSARAGQRSRTRSAWTATRPLALRQTIAGYGGRELPVDRANSRGASWSAPACLMTSWCAGMAWPLAR